MKKLKVIERDLGLDRITTALKRLDGIEAVAGFVEDERNATIGAIQEFGDEHIPSRPFMRTAFDENEGAYFSKLVAGIRHGLAGAGSNYNGVLKDVAEDMRDDITRSIIEWNDPENAPATVERKGFNDPLIETEEMVASVAAQVRKAGSTGAD